MAKRVVYCSGCHGAIVVDDALPFHPRECPYCRCASWNSPQQPTQEWQLTKDDRDFLRVQRIPEPEPVEDDGA